MSVAGATSIPEQLLVVPGPEVDGWPVGCGWTFASRRHILQVQTPDNPAEATPV